MNDYRTPEENQQQTEHETRVRAVLDQAVADGTSLVAAMQLGEPQDVVEMWTDRLWDGLREGLRDDHPENPTSRLVRDEDRLTAIVLLLTDRMYDEADKVVQGVDHG